MYLNEYFIDDDDPTEEGQVRAGEAGAVEASVVALNRHGEVKGTATLEREDAVAVLVGEVADREHREPETGPHRCGGKSAC